MTGIDLKVERIYRRLTLRQLAEKMNKSIGWLSQVENDEVKITPNVVIKYMEALDNKD